MTDIREDRKLAFEFAHMLGDPEFRQALRKAGRRKKWDVLVMAENEPFDSVMRRAIKQARPPVLLAIKRPDSFAVLRLEGKPWWLPRRRSVPPLRIAATTTIGMVFDMLEAHDARLAPERWSWFRLRPVEDYALAH